MEEIKIYHRPGRMVPLIAGSIGIVALFTCFILFIPDTEISVYFRWSCYACILFMGYCSLSFLASAVKEFVFRRPYITITDEHIVLQKWTAQTVNLTDVKTFKIAQSIFGGAPTENQEFVAVIYTPEAERRIKTESSVAGNIFRFINRHMSTQRDALDYITTQGTSFSAQELCDMLNERLRNYRAKKATP